MQLIRSSLFASCGQFQGCADNACRNIPPVQSVDEAQSVYVALASPPPTITYGHNLKSEEDPWEHPWARTLEGTRTFTLLGTVLSCGRTERHPVKDPQQYTQHEKEYPPDRYGEETGKNARVWKVYRDKVNERDADLLDGWNKTLDILLLFVRHICLKITHSH
jgi:hypothetical protein